MIISSPLSSNKALVPGLIPNFFLILIGIVIRPVALILTDSIIHLFFSPFINDLGRSLDQSFGEGLAFGEGFFVFALGIGIGDNPRSDLEVSAVPVEDQGTDRNVQH